MRFLTRHPFLWAIGGVVVLALVLVGLEGKAGLRYLVALELSREAGHPVTVNGLSVDFAGDPLLVATDVVIATPDPPTTVARLSVRLDRSALLHGRVHVLSLTLNEPRMTLARGGDGAWNWSVHDLSTGPAVDRVVIQDGKLRVLDPARKTDIEMSLASAETTAEDAPPLTANAAGTYRGLPIKARFTVRYADRVLRLAALSGEIGASDVAGTVSVSLQGERPSVLAELASRSAAYADLAGVVGLTRQRSDAARLIPDTPIDVGGLSSFDATVSYRATLIATESVPFRNGIARFTLAKGRLDVTALSAEAEGGRVAATLTLDDAAHGPHAVATLVFQHVDLKHFVPSDSVLQETGRFTGQARLDATGASLAGMLAEGQGSLAFTMSEGDLGKFLTRLPGVELTDPMLAALHLRTPKPIRCAAGNFMLAKGELTSRALVIDTAEGTLTGSGAIDLRAETIAYRLTPVPSGLPAGSLLSPIEIKGTLRRPAVTTPSDAPATSGLASALGTVLGPVEALIGTVENSVAPDSGCADGAR